MTRADDAVVAITGDGRIHLGDAAAFGWEESDLVAADPLALLATGSAADLEIVVLTQPGLVVSRGGASFVAWTPDV